MTQLCGREVNIAQEELDSFLAVAEELKIKGLTQSSSSAQPETHKNKGNPGGISHPANTANTRKRSPVRGQPRLEEDQEEIQEIPTIKTEPGGQSVAQYQEVEEEEAVVEDYDYEDQDVQYGHNLSSATLDYEQGKVSGESHCLSGFFFPGLKNQIIAWWDGGAGYTETEC